MNRTVIAAVALLLFAGPAQAWNDKGHMVVARLAWQKLSPETRQAMVKVLRAHPHYEEYLAADQPAELSTEEWVVWRAATWPDWLRDHHSAEYHKPEWHYINLPYVPPESHFKAADFPAAAPNVVTQIPFSIDKVRHGTAEEKAIYLCWVLHLVGDIHQPLHCADLYNEQFPEGDHGGNLDLIQLGSGRPTALHPMWDNLLGRSRSFSSVSKTVTEVQALAAENRVSIDQELAAHQTPESWAQEGLATAAKTIYLDGKLRVADLTKHPSAEEVPAAPDDYAKHCGHVARLCIAKAGERLAKVVEQCFP
jgi:hypothetical protein